MQAAIPTAAQVEQALERTYARPELQPREPGLMDGIMGWLREMMARLGEFLGRFGGLRTDNPIVYWLVIALLVSAALSIVLYMVRNTLVRLGDRDAAPAPRVQRGPALNARARTAAEWEDEARRAAAAGRFRDAAVALYQALLLRLEAAGAVRYDPAKTPGDYRREARRDPRAAGALTSFLRGFEPAVFGARPLDAEGYERLRAAVAGAGAHG